MRPCGCKNTSIQKTNNLLSGKRLRRQGYLRYNKRMSKTSLKWLRPLVVFFLALITYSYIARQFLTGSSVAPYFVSLANSFLHGRTDIEPSADNLGYDLIHYQDHWYVAQPPLPALLLMPVVLLRGVGHTSDVAFNVFLGACSVALCDIAIGAAVPTCATWKRNWLTLLFGLGTVLVSLSVLGTVWFMGQVAAAVFTWAFIWMVVSRRPLLAGTMLGLAILGRPFILPGALVFAAGYWLWLRRDFWECRSLRNAAVLFALPLIVSLSFTATYNYSRFGSPFDFGYSYLSDAPNIKQRRLTYGIFSPVFLPENLAVATVNPPIFYADCSYPLCAKIAPDPWGMGLLWTSPLLLYALLVVPFSKTERRYRYLLAVTIGLVLLPSLLYHNTGAAQFGYRFALDALPFWMVLLASEVATRWSRVMIAAILYSVAVNVWGAYWLINLIVLGRS
jgi:hypothetical protein